MICDHKPTCPHCKVAETLSPSDRIKWDALLRSFQMFPRLYDVSEKTFTARAESIRKARPFGRRAA